MNNTCWTNSSFKKWVLQGANPEKCKHVKSLFISDGRQKHNLFLFLRYFQNLSELRISDVGLVNIPEGVYTLKNLTNLNLTYNHISSISGEICKLENLKVVNFKGNYISFIHPDFFKMKNIISINLSWNNIKHIENYLNPSIFCLNLEMNKINKFCACDETTEIHKRFSIVVDKKFFIYFPDKLQCFLRTFDTI